MRLTLMRQDDSSPGGLERRRLRHVAGTTKSRRGAATVMALLFVMLFGAVVASMAVSSTGNVKSAATQLRAVGAMAAAETGLAVARDRLAEAAGRFVLAEAEIDGARGAALWNGDSAAVGQHRVTYPAPSGFTEAGSPAGIAAALVNHHNADRNIMSGHGMPANASITARPAGISATDLDGAGWVQTPAVLVEAPGAGSSAKAAFRVTYAPLASGDKVRVMVEGLALNKAGKPIFSRTISQDFELKRRVEHVVVSPSRVLLGKNARLEGDAAIGFDQVSVKHGSPLVSTSDFMGLDPALDNALNDFNNALIAADVDHDGRLRALHPVEGPAIPSGLTDYDGDGQPDAAFADATGDGFVDGFDMFINFYDQDGDGRIKLAADLSAGTPAENDGGSPEFTAASGTLDYDLAMMLDGAFPDRNRNGVSGYNDLDADGQYDPRYDEPADYDSRNSSYADVVLGWRDGYLDVMDRAAKIAGTVMFKTTDTAWTDQARDFGEFMGGNVVPRKGERPVLFGASQDRLPLVDEASFDATEAALQTAADGDPFWQQVADQLGISFADIAAWDYDSNSADPAAPFFGPLLPDRDLDGLPDNHGRAHFEPSPYTDTNLFNDWYYRPVFRNMVFRDVVIPQGLNALFENCQFIGVTHIRVEEANSHVLWSGYGKLAMDLSSGLPRPVGRYELFGDTADENSASGPPVLPDSALPPNQMIRLRWDYEAGGPNALDKGDVPGPFVSLVDNYNDLPDALVINGKRYNDTRELSNNIRFHDSLFVGSVITDAPARYEPVRNKLQFTGATRFSEVHPQSPGDPAMNPDAADGALIASTSLMAPHFSVDLGSVNAPAAQDIRLRGAVVAGVIDIRGKARVDGAVLATYDPQPGFGPLRDHRGDAFGNPALFNVSLGYFGDEHADLEGLDVASLPVLNGRRVAGWELNGEKFAADDNPGNGATPIYFNGYGRVEIVHDPDFTPPPGIWLPVSAEPVAGSYSEGQQ